MKTNHSIMSKTTLNNTDLNTPQAKQRSSSMIRARWLSSLAILFALSNTQAESSNEGQVYTVELIVFERLYQNTSYDPEVWRDTIAPHYPINWKHLIDPEKQADLITKPENEFREDDSLPIEGQDTLTTQTAKHSTDEQDHLALTIPQFTFLPDEMLTLGQEKKALARRNTFNVLFHEAWQQALYSEDNAPALIVLGGRQYGEHFELEGTITFSVDRYIHMTTNLWLSQFELDLGQTIEQFWPPLPSIPEPIHTLYSENVEENIAFSDEINEQTHDNTAAKTLNHTHADYSLSPLIVERENIEQGLNLQNSLDFDIKPARDNTYSGSHFTEHTINDFSERYLTQQIILLTQYRKMRSNELHYIDHPKIGILVKVMRTLPKN